MEFKPTRINPSRSGASLVEVLMALAIAGVVLAFTASFYLFSMRSFVSMTSHTDMNRQGRIASDILTRDIRSALSVASFNSNQLVLNAGDGSVVTYTYSSATNALTRACNGYSKLLLTGITPGSFAFNVCQRPTNTVSYEQFPAASGPANAKLIAFSWNCAKTMPTATATATEGPKSALVSIRNQ